MNQGCNLGLYFSYNNFNTFLERLEEIIQDFMADDTCTFDIDEFLVYCTTRKHSNWEDSMDEEETEEASLTESTSAIGDDGVYADIRKHTDMRGNDSNENEATTESASANKEGGIGKSTDSNQKHFKAPLEGAKKSKGKAIDMDKTERRMKEAYDIIKQSENTDPSKTTLCTAYGQLVTQRLETLSELQRAIVMNEIDNLFFRTTMG
ncbi:hypothetical protein FQA39_LY16534 [Lamprigera yunnana]|nr:hypothetical protein FQA39_LY16534 [Lamprigera yunnana]